MKHPRHPFQPEQFQPDPQEHADQPVVTRVLTSRALILIVGLATGGGTAWAMRPADPVKAMEAAPPVAAEARPAPVVMPAALPSPVKPEPAIIERTIERTIEKCAEPPKAAPKPPAPKPRPRPRPQPTAHDPWSRPDVVYAPVRRSCPFGIFCD